VCATAARLACIVQQTPEPTGSGIACQAVGTSQMTCNAVCIANACPAPLALQAGSQLDGGCVQKAGQLWAAVALQQPGAISAAGPAGYERLSQLLRSRGLMQQEENVRWVVWILFWWRPDACV
jgi:hypothetical protein